MAREKRDLVNCHRNSTLDASTPRTRPRSRDIHTATTLRWISIWMPARWPGTGFIRVRKSTANGAAQSPTGSWRMRRNRWDRDQMGSASIDFRSTLNPLIFFALSNFSGQTLQSVVNSLAEPNVSDAAVTIQFDIDAFWSKILRKSITLRVASARSSNELSTQCRVR